MTGRHRRHHRRATMRRRSARRVGARGTSADDGRWRCRPAATTASRRRGAAAAAAWPTCPARSRTSHTSTSSSTRPTPPPVPGHTTYRLGEEPDLVMPWTYADARPGGTFERVGGGGPVDPVTGHWGQGAYNADDISRAAVVYLRHWQLTDDATSRDTAYELLRSLAYLQTAEGPNAGNVVLWMQPDGELNPSAEPVELPDPSDSGPSYWLARTIWALRRGLRGLRRRWNGSRVRGVPRASGCRSPVDAVDRQVLDAVRRVRNVRRHAGAAVADRRRRRCHAPRRCWGSPPTSRRHPTTRAAADALRKLAEGIALMSAGDVRLLAVRRDPAVGAVAVDLARVGLADAGGARRGIRGARRRVAARRRGARLRVVHADAPDGRRTGQRVVPDPDRSGADRVRRGLARAVAARGGRRLGLARIRRPGRDAGRMVLRCQPRGRGRCTTPRPV